MLMESQGLTREVSMIFFVFFFVGGFHFNPGTMSLYWKTPTPQGAEITGPVLRTGSVTGPVPGRSVPPTSRP